MMMIAGQDGDTSILQPLWHPQTGNLYYISDQSNFYNIYRYSSGSGESKCILAMESDFGGAAPVWMLGQQGFGFLKDGRLLAQYKKDGKSVLLVMDVTTESVKEFGMDDGLPMQFGGMISGDEKDGDLYFLGASPSTSTSICKWNMNTKDPAKVLLCSSTMSFSEDVISFPQQIEFPTTNGKTAAFGYYYPPQNSNFQCTTKKALTLLVKAHGGPTSCTGTALNAGIQFWTSRGFAVIDVDYTGSTGCGREYRRRLRKSWGIVDIDDFCASATYLVEQGLADGNHLCINGGSAGGYTTLGALAFKGVFKAGCSLYGVGNLTSLAGDTHKFESQYLDGLVGAYPEEAELYKKRLLVESVETTSCPIMLLQGDEDKIVPPNQAEIVHQALLKKGIPTCLKIYKGEQHGSRKAENIEDALDSAYLFSTIRP
jgi:dipeptidyl aminopeptidase/acylaminoacyl peptidase